MTPVSAVLIIKNEEQFIERALRSLLWCDEIVVVDAESSDRTASICKDPGAPWAGKLKWNTQAWLGFSEQRNFAMKLASHDWIFFLDGDEACSPELAQKIQQLLHHPNGPESFQYKVRRQEFFLKKPIHYGIWNPSYHIRFFNKNNLQFVGSVHEGVKSTWLTRSIDEPIIHVEDLRIERFLTKLNHYTTLQAQADYARGLRTNFFLILMAFPAMFYKNYFYYRSYKDGNEGLIISVLEGISRTVRHLKIWQIQRQQ